VVASGEPGTPVSWAKAKEALNARSADAKKMLATVFMKPLHPP